MDKGAILNQLDARLQPGADKPSVVEKAHALDLHVIQDCVLVQLP